MAVVAGVVAGETVCLDFKTIEISKCVMNFFVNILCVDIVVGLVGRTTVMRMEAAAVVDDRVADVKVEEAMVVMEAMVEVAEEEVGDGEGHQVVQLLQIYTAPISMASI